MLRKNQRNLKNLIMSFSTTSIGKQLEELIEYVDHDEWGLAIEMLSDWIYEHDVNVSAQQEKTILKLSTTFGVDHGCHAFVGQKPPYPDLRSPDQIAQDL